MFFFDALKSSGKIRSNKIYQGKESWKRFEVYYVLEHYLLYGPMIIRDRPQKKLITQRYSCLQ